MKRTYMKRWAISLLILGVGCVPAVSFAWGHQGMEQRQYVTAPYWCGSYYSSYPCQPYPVNPQYQNYLQYQPFYTTYQQPVSYQPVPYQYVPTSYYYASTYTYQSSYYGPAQGYPYYNNGYLQYPPSVYPNTGYTYYGW